MTKNNILSRFRPWQSEFSHRYACWANNHRGWAKMKKQHRRLAKRRLNVLLDQEKYETLEDRK